MNGKGEEENGEQNIFSRPASKLNYQAQWDAVPTGRDLIPRVPSKLASKPGFRFRKWHAVVLGMIFSLVLCGVGVAGYFRLGSETTALRKSLMSSVSGQWEKKFAVHVGSLTLALVRAGSRLVNLPSEPRAALEALHGAEVGVYRLQQEPGPMDHLKSLVAADGAMKARGWERIVGVVQGQQLVAVYIPRKGLSPKKMACCLVVLQERDLVVASARGNVQPLLEIARKKLGSADGQLAWFQ